MGNTIQTQWPCVVLQISAALQLNFRITNMKVMWRYVLAWMGCLGIMNVYFCRINLSIAMVAMVGLDTNKTLVGPDNSSQSVCESRK